MWIPSISIEATCSAHGITLIRLIWKWLFRRDRLRRVRIRLRGCACKCARVPLRVGVFRDAERMFAQNRYDDARTHPR